MFPFQNIAAVERVETPLSDDMVNALNMWYRMYLDKAPWLSDCVKSMNLPSLICSEIARQVLLEIKWNITSSESGEDDKPAENARSAYLKTEFAKLMDTLRLKLEQGCAAGGMTIKPYPKDGHIYFDCSMLWNLYPVAFSDDGSLQDVIFRDTYQDGKTTYTRLERHTVDGENVKITQRAFKSSNRESLGVEIGLTEVPQWAGVEAESTITKTNGALFGWFKVASANNVDVDSPMGISVFNKATRLIEQADIQYSRLLWEYEGSELAIDVDPMALKEKADGSGEKEMPKLNNRLFRGVDLGKDDNYQVFSPSIRDGSLISGLNLLLMRIEDNCGLARGTLSDANQEARTATELRIVKQRTYATIADNQTSLERCLRDVVRTMDKYATVYGLAPEGDYDLSFEWDDSIITDTSQQLGERLELVSQGIVGKVELRQWYFGETKAQAEAAIEAAKNEAIQQNVDALLAGLGNGGQPPQQQEQSDPNPSSSAK